MPTKPMYSSLDTQITAYQWHVKEKKDREKAPEAKSIEFPLTFSLCIISLSPDREERFVKRITVERVKPSPALGKIEGDICM